MAKTRAMENRALRQEALREQLAEQCRVQHILETLKKIEELDEGDEHFVNALAKLRTVNEQRLKLLNKYLPDLKATEITGANGDPIQIQTPVQFVPPSVE